MEHSNDPMAYEDIAIGSKLLVSSVLCFIMSSSILLEIDSRVTPAIEECRFFPMYSSSSSSFVQTSTRGHPKLRATFPFNSTSNPIP